MRTKSSFFLLSLLLLPLATTYADTTSADFSSYSTPTTVISNATTGTGSTTTYSSAYINDSSSDTTFKVYGGTAGAASVSDYTATITNSGTANYLRLATTKTSGSGQPYSHVSTTTAFAPTTTDTLMTYSISFNVSAMASGTINVGLYAYNALTSNGSYALNQTSGNSTVGFTGSTIGLSLVLNTNSGTPTTVGVLRTGIDNSQYIESYNTSTQLWSDGVTSTSLAWSFNTNYTAVFQVNTTTGLMELALINADTGSTLMTVDSYLDQLGAQATAGGLRFSAGNLENNSTNGNVMNITDLAISSVAVPEPSTIALLLGSLFFGLSLWRRPAYR